LNIVGQNLVKGDTDLTSAALNFDQPVDTTDGINGTVTVSLPNVLGQTYSPDLAYPVSLTSKSGYKAAQGTLPPATQLLLTKVTVPSGATPAADGTVTVSLTGAGFYQLGITILYDGTAVPGTLTKVGVDGKTASAQVPIPAADIANITAHKLQLKTPSSTPDAVTIATQ
jgi:hypothetical protein